jgi:hypothetical protein
MEGWTDPGGTDVVRRDLAEEAFFLARLVAELLPEQPETLGLVALMLHAEARRESTPQRVRRVCAASRPESCPLDRIHESVKPKPYCCAPALWAQLDAINWRLRCSRHTFIAARTGHNNWAAVVQLYDALLAVSASPVVGNQSRSGSGGNTRRPRRSR